LVNQGGQSYLGGKQSGTHSQKKEFMSLSLLKSGLRKHLLLVGESKGERVSTQGRQILSSNVG